MLFYLLIPLVLILVVLCSGWVLYDRLRNDLPAFEQGRFRRSEYFLLNKFTELLHEDDTKKIQHQLRYFSSKGKYWRFVGEHGSGVELYEEETDALEEAVLLGFDHESVLAVVCFELKGKSHEIRFRSLKGRLYGWTVSPSLPKAARFEVLKIKSATLVDYPVVSKAEAKHVPERNTESSNRPIPTSSENHF